MSNRPADQPLLLNPVQAGRIAPLLGIGCQSGDVVLGLSAVRRVKRLAYVLVSRSLADGTVRQLMRLARQGTQVYRVEDMGPIRAGVGRAEISVLGIKPGPLAQGVEKQLSPP